MENSIKSVQSAFCDAAGFSCDSLVVVKRKRSTCTALPLQSLQISQKIVSPAYRINGIWGEIGSGSTGRFRTSKYLDLFEFTLEELKILALI